MAAAAVVRVSGRAVNKVAFHKTCSIVSHRGSCVARITTPGGRDRLLKTLETDPWSGAWGGQRTLEIDHVDRIRSTRLLDGAGGLEAIYHSERAVEPPAFGLGVRVTAH